MSLSKKGKCGRCGIELNNEFQTLCDNCDDELNEQDAGKELTE